jgi:glycerol-3-phosphate dehydrogenase (NAD(P)+)
MKEKIAVLGGGTWGATLAAHLAERGHDVCIWEFMPKIAEELRKNRGLKTLPQLHLPESVEVTNDLEKGLLNRNVILSVTPSQTVRSVFTNCKNKKILQPGCLVISASKGIENGTFATMSQVIQEMFPDNGGVVVLSGPSHAEEVASHRPVALVAASSSSGGAERVRDLFSSDLFRVYTSTDPLGVELGGSIKNVYALACGIVDGLSLGDNTKAALITRGLLEMTRLGSKLGAQTITFFGLSGLGDMIVTCGSQHSRNRLLGEKLGRGKSLDEALSEMTMVAEGVATAKSAYFLAKAKNVDVPIINEIYSILFEKKSAKDSIKDLMSRQVGAEMEGITL